LGDGTTTESHVPVAVAVPIVNLTPQVWVIDDNTFNVLAVSDHVAVVNDTMLTFTAPPMTAGTYGLALIYNYTLNAIQHNALTYGPDDTIFKNGFDGTGGGGGFTQPLQDPSFEATTTNGGSNPFWAGTDTNVNAPPGATPFYSLAFISPSPHSGNWVVFFGGWYDYTAETMSFSQSVTIASGGARYLNYWRAIAAAPDNATMTVYVDGTAVSTVNLAALGVDADWTQVSIDISTYANNAAHTIKFEFSSAAGGLDGALLIDDVAIDDHN
jgi:hypothetical protein